MRVFLLIHHSGVVEFDVEILIYRMQSSLDGQVVLELNCDLKPEETGKVPPQQVNLVGSRRHDCQLIVTSLPTSVLKYE